MPPNPNFYRVESVIKQHSASVILLELPTLFSRLHSIQHTANQHSSQSVTQSVSRTTIQQPQHPISSSLRLHQPIKMFHSHQQPMSVPHSHLNPITNPVTDQLITIEVVYLDTAHPNRRIGGQLWNVKVLVTRSPACCYTVKRDW